MNQQSSESTDRCSIPDLRLKGFNVYEIDTSVRRPPVYSRRDFYKVTLTTAHMMIHYADRSIETDGPFLFFANPHIPYSVELLSDRQTGFSCVFTETFLSAHERSESLQQSPLFKIGGTPVIPLNEGQVGYLTTIYLKMLAEQHVDYAFKDELIRNFIQLIIHEALKWQPADNFHKPPKASSRIALLFLELLERQFPIEDPHQPLTLRSAQDYASRLSVHVNHLNRSVRETTGKPTTTHISDRIISEAKALLQHTSWSIADIAYGLGFEYPTHFNNYFKRMTGAIPKSFRAKPV